MFSVGSVAVHLLSSGIETDVAGVLSPMAVHTYQGRIERAINTIRGDMKRFIHAPTPVPIRFVDASAPKFYKEVGIGVGKYFDLSIRFGTEKLILDLERLIETEGYDLIVAVDVGGDVFARGRKDPTVLTPLADFALLYAISRLPVDSVLVGIGLGTDGELRPTGMSEILAGLRTDGSLISEFRLSATDPAVIALRKLYEKVSAIRKGNTMGRLLQTLEVDQDIPIRHRHHSQIGGRSWNVYYDSVIPGEYASIAYVVNLKMLAESRRETAFAFSNPLEQYVRMKRVTTEWATELDLGYVWSDQDWMSPHREGYCLHLLVPSRRIPFETRMEILSHGIRKTEADYALVLNDDIALLSHRMSLSQYPIAPAGAFGILTIRRGGAGFTETIADQVSRYHD
ncbi:MAG: DUF1152 domain-containing protein [Candidatus Moraniibacteriota bacterium]